MTETILATKLYIPRSRPTLVQRPRLIKKLNKCVQCKLVLISAPAGFGKTTLVTEWLDKLGMDDIDAGQTGHRFAWLSLDEDDNNPPRFLTYFLSALNRLEGMQSPIGKRLLDQLQSQQPPSVESALTALINEIVASPHRIVFVLDDYHLIEAQPIHDALIFLLEHLPHNFHLVITTREDPPFPLARLHARNDLVELRASDLRFTQAEAAEFLYQVMGLRLSEEDITALENRTEGWIAGLQLAALSMQGRADTAGFIKAFTGSHRLVLDYLIEEVLEQQRDDIRAFLLNTAILDKMNASLCDAVTGQQNSQEILEMLERANLFITPLDEARRWYRYHQLFKDVLLVQLMKQPRDKVADLHRRASAWFEQRKLPSEAIRHALANREFIHAADMAELAWPAWKEGYYAIAWLGWVKDLPEELVRSRPVLSAAFAMAFLNAGNLEEAETHLVSAEAWMDKNADRKIEQLKESQVFVDEDQFLSLPATLASTRAYLAMASGNIPDVIKYAGRTLELLPEDDRYNRSAITALLGLANWASGDLEKSYQSFSVGVFASDHDQIKGTFALADIMMTLGYLQEALYTYEVALQLAKDFPEPNPIGTEDVYSGMSLVHYELGDLDAAEQDLAMSKKLGDQVELPDWQYRWHIARAILDQGQGNLDDALDHLQEAERVFVRTPLPVVRPIAAMQARVWIRQGRLARAQTWARERGLAVDDELTFLREFEHITLVRILIAQYKKGKSDNAIKQAAVLLRRLLHAADNGKRMGTVIEILVLLAVAYQSQGDTPTALKYLERAVRLAEPEGYLRVFVDEGAPLVSLLQKLPAEHETLKAYIRKLLDAFPTVEAQAPPSPAQPLIEPLSERELEVLHLIARGLTNHEVGASLFLSLNTVKVHTRNIYSKLDVNNRTQAVARARDLGLLNGA